MGAVFASGVIQLGAHEVLLDNQANISIVNPCLLSDVRTSAAPCNVAGVTKGTLTLQEEGVLEGFFTATYNIHSEIDNIYTLGLDKSCK